jgi:hypothetical protein
VTVIPELDLVVTTLAGNYSYVSPYGRSEVSGPVSPPK